MSEADSATPAATEIETVASEPAEQSPAVPVQERVVSNEEVMIAQALSRIKNSPSSLKRQARLSSRSWTRSKRQTKSVSGTPSRSSSRTKRSFHRLRSCRKSWPRPRAQPSQNQAKRKRPGQKSARFSDLITNAAFRHTIFLKKERVEGT